MGPWPAALLRVVSVVMSSTLMLLRRVQVGVAIVFSYVLFHLMGLVAMLG